MKNPLLILAFCFMIFSIASWFNNINFIIDSWDKESLQIREVISIVGIPVAPIGTINGAIYFFEDEVSY